MDPHWLRWTRRIHALAQNGSAYTEGIFDRERYAELKTIAAEMMAAYGDTTPERVLGLWALEEGYATPKVDVRAAVLGGGEILLVRERSDGRWALPGGWADVGDTPAQCVEREVLEEAGLTVRATHLVAVHDGGRNGHPPRPFHVYKLLFLCELVGGVATTSNETDEVAFFREDDLPPLSFGRVNEGQIALCFRHMRDPMLPTEFD
ncbi:MAG TPA: NUDIX hydrolase [Longimicrobium sp.]|nr:NUDIX hydrolase [Longimicrobium sp.]